MTTLILISNLIEAINNMPPLPPISLHAGGNMVVPILFLPVPLRLKGTGNKEK